MGISIFSGLWTFAGTLVFALLLAVSRKGIIKISSGPLLKVVCFIGMFRAGTPVYMSNIRFPSILYLLDMRHALNPAVDYKIDYYAKDVFFENTPLRLFPAMSTGFVIIFAVVSLMFFVYDFRKYYYMYFHMKYLKVKPDKRMEEIARKVQQNMGKKTKMIVYCHSSIPFSSVIGFFRPIVFIPDIAWTDAELYDLFEHEYLHFLHGDAWWKAILLIIKNLNWWNIPIHWLFKCVEWACEYHVDFDLTRFRNKKSCRIHYARTIIKSLEHCKELIKQRKANGKRRFAIFAGASAFTLPYSEKFALERFEAFVPEAPKAKAKSLSALIVILSFAFALSSFAFIPFESSPAVDYLQGDYIYFIEKEDGTYDMYMDGVFQYNVIATRAEIESMGPPEYIFSEVPDLETVKQIGRK